MRAIISDVEYPIRTNSLNIEDQIESRSSANFAVKDLQDEHTFQKGQQVELKQEIGGGPKYSLESGIDLNRELNLNNNFNLDNRFYIFFDYIFGLTGKLFNLFFSGFIEMSEKVALSYSGNYIHQITCVDNHYLADKRIVVMAETDTTAGAMVEQIVERYLESEGVVNTNKYWDDYSSQTWNEVLT